VPRVKVKAQGSSLNQQPALRKYRPYPLSSSRTGISYYAAPEMATCAAFIEESRMMFCGTRECGQEIRGSGGICSSLKSEQMLTEAPSLAFETWGSCQPHQAVRSLRSLNPRPLLMFNFSCCFNLVNLLTQR
jgi:hypothetical protein